MGERLIRHVPTNEGMALAPKDPRVMMTGMLAEFGGKIPDDVKALTFSKLDQALNDWNEPGVREPANAAFLIHTRRTEGSEEYLDDAGRCFPALRMEYGIPFKRVEEFWNTLPPFEVGRTRGTLPGGQEISLSIISTQITPKNLEEARGPRERLSYARPKIEDAVRLAQKFGSKTIGLGETLASLTLHAKTLEKTFTDINFATGHAFTTHYIGEWIRYAADLRGERLDEIPVTILGAAGSIGSSSVELLAEGGVGGLILHDKPEFNAKLREQAATLVERYPNLKGKIFITGGGDENLADACQRSHIIVCATSNPEPFIRAEHLNKQSVIINDSQPPGITLSEARRANSISPWVLGQLPEGLINSFDYGILDGAEWTCALEVIAKAAGGDFETTGPVTVERVKGVGELARAYGFGIPLPQAFGEPISLDMFQDSSVH